MDLKDPFQGMDSVYQLLSFCGEGGQNNGK
jgi:hypothetical protein